MINGIKKLRHTGGGRCPYLKHWIPASTGMTIWHKTVVNQVTDAHP